jgi:hypothetical protein
MVPRTALVEAVPSSLPTSLAPDRAVTSVFFTRFTTPTAMISAPVIVRLIARSTPAPWPGRAPPLLMPRALRRMRVLLFDE